MNDLKSQFVSALLFILTVAAVSCAIVNFRQQRLYHFPEDGVTWVDRAGTVVALHVDAGGQAEKAGIRNGDVLHRLNGFDIRKASDVPLILSQRPIWSKAPYDVHRGGVEVMTSVILGENVVDSAISYQYFVGIVYLLTGLFHRCMQGYTESSSEANPPWYGSWAPPGAERHVIDGHTLIENKALSFP